MPGVSSPAPRPQIPVLFAAAEELLSWIFPSNCLACSRTRRGVFGEGICEECWRSFPALDPGSCCERCALPGSSPSCRHCLKSPPPLSRTFAAGLYEGSLRAMIRAFKFDRFDHLGECLGRRLSSVFPDVKGTSWDAIVPLPSTRGRNRDRGFDPADLIARELSRTMRLPCRSFLARTRETHRQSRLPRERRWANVEGAFTASARAEGKKILLVDDIMTTGATAFSAAEALRRAGAQSVSLAVLARTPELAEDSHLEAL